MASWSYAFSRILIFPDVNEAIGGADYLVVLMVVFAQIGRRPVK
jgi:uncharacterized membrane protein YkvA (DUF1232 family)